MMKLCLITVCKDAGDVLGEALESVRRQAGIGRDFELAHLIQDGGSGDGSLALAEAYRREAGYAVDIVSERDSGFYDGINRALARLPEDADVVGLLNADDTLSDEGGLRAVAAAFEREALVGAVYSDLEYVTAEGRTHRRWRAGEGSAARFRRGWMPPHPTVYARRNVYMRVGGYRLDFGSAADYEWLVRLFVLEQVKARYLPMVTVRMRVGGQSNESALGRLQANRSDRRAWTVNGVRPALGFRFWKPLRKVGQFLPGICLRGRAG